MAFQSMTGFSQGSFSDGHVEISLELRSVNGKGLDLRVRLPQEFSHLEQVFRKKLGEKMQRGTVQGILNMSCKATQSVPIINEVALQTYLDSAKQIAEKNLLEMPRIEKLMSLPGVIQFNGEQGAVVADEACQKAIQLHIETLFDEVLNGLVKSRQQEGAALAALFQSQIARLVQLVSDAKKDTSLDPKTMRERLQRQVGALLGDEGGNGKDFDGDRIYQEVAVLINRSDVKEELDRLEAHLVAVAELLSLAETSHDATGKKLDFLAQELNREANTLCSKSISPSLSAIGVELKTTIDQFREQVQNLQ